MWITHKKDEASGGTVNICCLLSCTCCFVSTAAHKYNKHSSHQITHARKNPKRLFEITHQRRWQRQEIEIWNLYYSTYKKCVDQQQIIKKC